MLRRASKLAMDAPLSEPSLAAATRRTVASSDSADEAVSLVAVCAWCGRPLGRARPSARTLVSHGMCRPCLEDVLASHGRELVARR